MIRVTFIAHSGDRRTVDAARGMSVMEAATRHGVVGIEAECGGACACATCHIYVDEAFLGKVGPATASEIEMLAFAADVRPNSRLACQINLGDDLDGLIVHTPARQG